MNNAERDVILGISKWKEHLSAQPVEVGTPQLKVLRSPGVYVYLIGDIAAYVGKSKNVGERCFGKGHHKSELFEKCTSVIIFPCKSDKDADQLEALLIFDLKPSGNGRGNRKHVKSLDLPYALQNWQQNRGQFHLPASQKQSQKALPERPSASLIRSRRDAALTALTATWSATSENLPVDSPTGSSD